MPAQEDCRPGENLLGTLCICKELKHDFPGTIIFEYTKIGSGMDKGKIVIREAEVEDAEEIMKLHERSVLGLCHNDYSAEQLEGWVRNSTLEKYQKRLRLHRSWIAEKDNQTVGYVRWNLATNELCSIFVDPKHVRQGIATKLMRIAYDDALEAGAKELWLDASLTAVPFYQVQGWETIEKMMHGPLECVRMRKQLLPFGENK